MTWTASPFKHSRKREKDGKFLIKIKLRNTKSNYQSDFPVERIIGGEILKLILSDIEWVNKSKINKRIIHFAESSILRIAKYLEKNGDEISNKQILFYYRKLLKNFEEEETIDQIRGLLSIDLDNQLVESFSDSQILLMVEQLNKTDLASDLSEEEISTVLMDAAMEVTVRIPTRKEIEATKKIKNNLDRCDAQYRIPSFFDENRILDVFGFFWTLKKTNGDRTSNKWNQRIVLRLAQFIFMTGASNNIKDFNFEWIQSYFLYLRDFGFLDNHEIRNYTPLELYEYRDKIIAKKKDCKSYQKSSFEDQIKKFKTYYIKLKEKTNFLDNIPKIDISEFNFKNLKLSESNFDIEKSQKDHYVNLEELKLLAAYKSEDEILNLTRDQFFLQTFSSGNRSINKDNVEIKLENGFKYVEVRHSKTKSKNKTGTFKFFSEVVERHNGKIPNIIITAKEYNKNLKKIAKELKFERKIQFFTSKVNSNETLVEYKPLKNCISQYFSRHTLVNYLVDAGEEDDDIIKLTGHSTTKILDHYKKRSEIDEKQKIINRADKKNLGKL